MALTATGSRPLHSRLQLQTANIVEGKYQESRVIVGPGFGIYSATKSRKTIEQCVDLINRGGTAALVPTSASSEYMSSIAEQVERFAGNRLRSESNLADGILVLPTSGSTGIPKLVALTAAGLIRFLGWGRDYFRFDEDTVSLSLSPWNFDVSLLDTWAVSAAGGTVVAAESA